MRGGRACAEPRIFVETVRVNEWCGAYASSSGTLRVLLPLDWTPALAAVVSRPAAGRDIRQTREPPGNALASLWPPSRSRVQRVAGKAGALSPPGSQLPRGPQPVADA